MEEQDREQTQKKKRSSPSSLDEPVSVYFRCPAGLLKQVEEIAKLTGFSSKEEAIRQALREFLEHYTPEYYKASQITASQVSTMADMHEKYPSVQSLITALRSQIAAMP